MMKSSIKLFLFLSLLAQAEEIDLKRILSAILAKDYHIQLQQIDLKIAQEATSQATGGLLPSLDLVGHENYKTSDPTSQSDGWTSSVGLESNWILFDGFRMFAAYESLYENEKLASMSYRKMVEERLYSAISLYGQLYLSQKQSAFYEEQLNWFDSKLRLVDKSVILQGLSEGQKSLRLEREQTALRLLQSKRDQYEYSQMLKEQTGFSDDTLMVKNLNPIALIEDEDAFLDRVFKENPDVRILAHRIALNEMDQTIQNSKFFPQITAQASLNQSWADHEFDAGVKTLNAGLRLRWNLFNGFSDVVAKSKSKLENQKWMLQDEEQKKQLKRIVHLVFNDLDYYKQAQERMDLVLKLNREEFAKAQLMWAQGSLSALDFRSQKLQLEKAFLESLQLELQEWLLKQKALSLVGAIQLELR